MPLLWCKKSGCSEFAIATEVTDLDTRNFYCGKHKAEAIARGESGERPNYDAPQLLNRVMGAVSQAKRAAANARIQAELARGRIPGASEKPEIPAEAASPPLQSKPTKGPHMGRQKGMDFVIVKGDQRKVFRSASKAGRELGLVPYHLKQLKAGQEVEGWKGSYVPRDKDAGGDAAVVHVGGGLFSGRNMRRSVKKSADPRKQSTDLANLAAEPAHKPSDVLRIAQAQEELPSLAGDVFGRILLAVAIPGVNLSNVKLDLESAGLKVAMSIESVSINTNADGN